ncbi:hypothetical protein [Dyadobacter sp. NIV53]|uniref:hypothetical protein n=1 Tax=Dyadobacter sp. NIV53 TaxID=2861765 RepID=UPI001C870BAF|nr:hypothetical protein [Dyadobacter sp. NIV53]
MKICILTPIYFLISISSFAQSTGNTYKVKNGTDISQAIPFGERYKYELFRNGKVYFRNGKISTAKLNYSLFHGEIQFINLQNDTLMLADNDFIDRIEIGNDLFYYVRKNGHIWLKNNFGEIKLAEKQRLMIMGKEKYSAYDQYSATSSISSYSSFNNGNGVALGLKGNDKAVLRKKSIYYLIDKNQRFYLANKASLFKIYPEKKRILNGYLKENDIDFNNEQDLINLLQFSSSVK